MTTDTQEDEARRLQEIMERHAPEGFDPAWDDMTVEFAIKLGEQDEQIATLTRQLAEARAEIERLKK